MIGERRNTVNPLYNDIRYNSKIRYNVNLVCTKISGSYIFLLMFPFYSSGKHTFCIFVRIAWLRVDIKFLYNSNFALTAKPLVLTGVVITRVLCIQHQLQSQ